MAENSSGHVRVTPQLIRVVDDTHLWVGHYQAETIVGVLDVQTTVARHVAKALDVAIEDDQHLSGFPSAARTTDPVAYTLYLKGRHFWSQRTGASLPVAIDYLEQAIARDSQFAAAYAALAHAHVVRPLYTNAAPADAWRAAREAAETALMLDSTLSEAHAALGFGLTAYEWKWAEADSSFRRAIALNPNDATTRNWYSALLGITGRVDETVAEARRATELDPFSSVVGADFGWLLYSMGRYDEAIVQLERTIGLDSLFAPAYATLACVYLKRGDLAQAVVAAERAVTLSDRDAERLGILSRVLATAGHRAEAGAILIELEQRADREYVPPTAIATAYLGRDDRENALRWLAKAVDQRDAVFVLDHQDPLYDPIRFDPTFMALLQRMGLGNLRGSAPR